MAKKFYKFNWIKRPKHRTRDSLARQIQRQEDHIRYLNTENQQAHRAMDVAKTDADHLREKLYVMYKGGCEKYDYQGTGLPCLTISMRVQKHMITKSTDPNRMLNMYIEDMAHQIRKEAAVILRGVKNG